MSPVFLVLQWSEEERLNNYTNKFKITIVATTVKKWSTALRNPKWETWLREVKECSHEKVVLELRLKLTVKSTQVEGTASSWLQHGIVSIPEQDSWKTRIQAPALRRVLCLKGCIMGWWQPRFKSQLSLPAVQPLARHFTLAKPNIPPLEVGMVIYDTIVIMNIRLLYYFSYSKGFQEKGSILFFSVSLTIFVQKGGTK